MTRPRRRRHHVVSRFYLRYFANESGVLTTVRLPGDRTFSQSVNDASVQNDYYTVLDVNGEESDMAEEAFGRIERAAADTWAAVARGEWPLEHAAREAIAGWIALHLLRTDRVRSSMSDIGSEILQLQIILGGRARLRDVLREAGEPCDDESVDREWIDLFRNPTAVVPHATHHVAHISTLISQVTTSILDRWWLQTRFERKRLATSDSPVAIVPNERNIALGRGTGILNADVLGLPLTRTMHLALARRDSLPPEMARLPDYLQPGVALTALYSNDVTAKTAHRYIYHHPKDSPLVGLQLPQPRSRQIEESGDPWRFMSSADRKVLEDAGITSPRAVDES